jgi:hypothetical protein
MGILGCSGTSRPLDPTRRLEERDGIEAKTVVLQQLRTALDLDPSG